MNKDIFIRLKIVVVLCMIMLCVFISSCQKNVSLADDTWYVTDGDTILLLCQGEPEQKDYIEIAKQLKGNYLEVHEAVNKLQKLEQTVPIQNALAVGYIRLYQIDEAEQVLKSALEEVETDEETACVLSNLGAVEWWNVDQEASYKYFRKASQKNTADQIQQLAIQTNLVEIKSIVNKVKGKDIINEIREMKRLLRKEKKLLGSNQMLGIYNYQSLGIASGIYEAKLDRGEKYFNKALNINETTYHYPDLEADIEYNLAVIYSDYKNNYDQALEHINKAIDALDGWLPENHRNVLANYLIRGDILSNLHQTEEAMADYNRILKNCKPVSEYAVLAYYYIGYDYEEQGENEKAVAAYINAYCINQSMGEKKIEEDSYDKLFSLYRRGKYEDEGLDFEDWLKKKNEEYVGKREN